MDCIKSRNWFIPSLWTSVYWPTFSSIQTTEQSDYSPHLESSWLLTYLKFSDNFFLNMNHTYINLDVTSILLLVKVNTDMLKQMVNKDIKRISKYNKENIHSHVEHDQNKPTYCITTKMKNTQEQKREGSSDTTKCQVLY